MNLNNLFAFDRAGFFLALTFGFIGTLVIIYSLAHRRYTFEFYLFTILMILAGIGVAFGQNLLFIFTFWEISTICLWRLIGFYRGKADIAAAEKAFLVNFGAATLMIVGLAVIFQTNQTLDLARLRGTELSVFAATLLFIGILAKSAIIPLYIWLPSAYEKAPLSVCALLSGICENIGLVLFLKLFVFTVNINPNFFIVTGGIAVASSIITGAVALLINSTRQILAFSTISQMGFILLAFSTFSHSNPITLGILGGLLYILAHSLGKSGLFFSLSLAKSKQNYDRFIITGFAMLTLSIIGMPPFIGFFGKIGIILGAIKTNLILGIGSVIAAFFTLLYLIRLFSGIFFQRPRLDCLKQEASQTSNLQVESQIRPRFVTVLILLLGIISLLIGILFSIPARYLLLELGGI